MSLKIYGLKYMATRQSVEPFRVAVMSTEAIFFMNHSSAAFLWILLTELILCGKYPVDYLRSHAYT
ncbi:hypothetical protein HMPREF1207_00068 [Paenibacillus sp. HGH0039]|nr:hypothetical protein HMPREF1207_00068 [Paenibacillus sp. HGH0039]